MKKSLTATQLRLILSGSLLFVAIAAGVAIHFANESLRGYATDISHVTADANASQDNVQTLQKIEKELKEYKEVVARASGIVAESQSYQYQDQIITDLNEYAKKAGIAITNLDFSASTTTTPAAPAASVVPAAPTATATPTGVKSTSVSVTIKNPVVYNNLLRFIKSIEQNLTKMQISRVGLSKDPTTGGIASEAFTIEVYIK